MSNAWSFETRQIHAGQEPDSATGARSLPIYQTTSFVFPSAESAANRFALAELAPIYTRIGNPTQDAVEQRVASLEGGLAALLLSSGQAAETFAILNVAEAGDHVVASPSLYGGTYNLLAHTLKKFGIAVTFAIHILNGVPLRCLFRPFLEIEQRDDSTVLIKVKESAVFCNWIPFKRQIENSGLLEGKSVTIDLSEAKIVDHSVMEKLHELQFEFEQHQLRLDVVGLENHRTSSRCNPLFS